MKLPVIQGLIRRRILANFRVDPEVMQRQLPPRFRPKLQRGFAVAGICLIRLEHIRPRFVPEVVGMNSENAAHRVAVLWDDEGVTREGVFISRRDTNSQLNHLLGGRIFPGEHHQSSFSIKESDSGINFSLESADSDLVVKLEAATANALPATSIFSSLAEASAFFEARVAWLFSDPRSKTAGWLELKNERMAGRTPPRHQRTLQLLFRRSKVSAGQH